MPATRFPVPCSNQDVQDNFLGLGDVLGSLADYTGKSEEELFEEYGRTATQELEDKSCIPFFVTRYCTKDLARQLGLTLGVDYDRYCKPQDYEASEWAFGTGRIELDHGYLAGVDLFRFTTSGQQGQLWDVPADWINTDDEKGIIHTMPGVGSATVFTSRVTGIFPQVRLGLDYVPNMIHLRYRAGLVTPDDYATLLDDYDANAALDQTDWDPNLVLAYRKKIGQHAAGTLMRKLANEWDGAGSQVSFDGLSQSVSPQVLEKRADQAVQEAIDWATKVSGKARGPKVVFV